MLYKQKISLSGRRVKSMANKKIVWNTITGLFMLGFKINKKKCINNNNNNNNNNK